MFLRSQIALLRAEREIMHPYEWGILDVKGLNFYPISNCADCTNIAPAVVETLVAAQASITATFLSHLGSDRQGALLLASYHRQRFNRLFSAIASVAMISTNKLN
jgi:hypothetical protein